MLLQPNRQQTTDQRSPGGVVKKITCAPCNCMAELVARNTLNLFQKAILGKDERMVCPEQDFFRAMSMQTGSS